MGLSQLYQLRGRVGRSERLAHAYLTFKPDKILSETAEKRLRAIKEFTEFGSGFKIALKDLEIRGAGSVIGSKQHGHMNAVGYDLYAKLLQEAVDKIKGEPEIKKVETSVDLPINAFIPGDYIKNHAAKIEAYKRIAEIETEEERLDVYGSLLDRFGAVPECAENLTKIALVKNAASKVNITEISGGSGGVLKLFFAPDNPPPMKNVDKLLKIYDNKMRIMSGAKPCFKFTLAIACDITYLTELEKIVNMIGETSGEQ
jgi:transcription-repair coupling factor (superfamily II helicase)